MNYGQRKIYLDLLKSIFTSEGYENVLSELKIKSVVRKIQNYKNKWI